MHMECLRCFAPQYSTVCPLAALTWVAVYACVPPDSSIMIPLDTVKTRLVTQTAQPGVVPYRGVLPTLSRVVREEGLGPIYRSLTPRLMSVVPMIGIQVRCCTPDVCSVLTKCFAFITYSTRSLVCVCAILCFCFLATRSKENYEYHFSIFCILVVIPTLQA